MHRARTTTTPFEALSLVAICFGWFIAASIQSVLSGFSNAGGFSDQSFTALIVIELVFGAIALAILNARHYAVTSLYPKPSLRGAGLGVALYLAASLASWVLAATLSSGKSEQPIDLLVSEGSPSLTTVVALALVNGTYEEMFLLGFLLGPNVPMGSECPNGVSPNGVRPCLLTP
jgi:hypothetical protein